MSLDKATAIPVDTHVWQIAKRDYGFGRSKAKKRAADPKTLTARLYDEVGDHFRSLFGEYSGWAHSVGYGEESGIYHMWGCDHESVFGDSVIVLFAADLKSFETRVVGIGNIKNKITDAASAVDKKLPFKRAKRKTRVSAKEKEVEVKEEIEASVAKRPRRK
ncbi:hypothetical protein BC938DRAFT_475828 [Jimgerdemannia flammicorona]|uniref:DNA-(apurinic or apyrimidinic site) lyase n=1 Tax=Jimgerdemannia flammicorona TaxID=994334 RepID=A0A433PNB7_9FUNG|nr:hypothetical protein BC938DRAFT_475828 [Jimgerdemannia flammicorona]